MGATSIGLWLVGVGSVAAAVSIVFESPPRAWGIMLPSPRTARPHRVNYAIRAVALAFIAAGGATVAAAELPSFWIALLTLVTFGAGVWLAAAWTQHRVWVARREQFASEAAESRRWRAEIAHHCARWRWALLHPFNGEMWPQEAKRRFPPT